MGDKTSLYHVLLLELCLRMTWQIPKASGLYNYSRLIKNNTTYAKRMNRLSAQIFVEPKGVVGEHHVPGLIKRFSQNPIDQRATTVHYYDHAKHRQADQLIKKLREIGLYRDEHADFAEMMEEQRYLRNKGSRRFLEKIQIKYNRTKKELPASE